MHTNGQQQASNKKVLSEAPPKPAKGGALSTAGYYDPARIEVGKTRGNDLDFGNGNFDDDTVEEIPQKTHRRYKTL